MQLREPLKNTLIATAIVIIVVLTGLFVLQVHKIQQGTDEALLWNDRDAYLFVNLTTLGYHPTCFRFLVDAAKEYSYRLTSRYLCHGIGRGGTSRARRTSIDNVMWRAYDPSFVRLRDRIERDRR